MKGILATILGIAAAVRAQVAQSCQDSACYSVHVPKSAASSGNGDIYFQIKAPTSYTWAALGQGDGMAGANIFVIYSNSAGTNVTLSPRLGVGHVQPLHDTNAQVTLLEGSGISNGMMVANVLCKNCNSWSGGTMSFNDANSNWIWSWKGGDPVNSDSPSATLEQHDDMGLFNFDLTKAAGGADSTNPFVTTSGGTASPEPTVVASASSSGDAAEMMTKNMITAHGTIMGLTMVLLFPLGAMLRRLAPGTSIWLHAGWQMFAYCLAIAGMGIGIWVAVDTDLLMETHPVIGLIVVCLLSLQPLGGLLQHSHYRKHGNRSIFGWGHKALGFALILLGIINGGLGLQLAANSKKGMIAYGVIAGVVGVAWLGIVAFGASTKRQRPSKEAANNDSTER